ncbi:MAG: hypothetical protein WC813_01375 [Patescibacteria group bacterium]|jgi:hypothetical protein
MFLIGSVAFGKEIKRSEDIHVDKVCGPVPWEAFQYAKYKETTENAQDVSAEGQADVVAKTGTAQVGVKNNASLYVEGEVVDLDLTGDQWTVLYLAYMECVSQSDSSKDVKTMWQQAVKGKIIKSMDDVSAFMTSAPTLRNSSANIWWKEMKEMIGEEFDLQDEKIKIASTRVDALYEVIAELQEKSAGFEVNIADLQGEVTSLQSKVSVLETNVTSLQTEVAGLRDLTDGQNVLFKKDLKEMDVRLSIMETLMKSVDPLADGTTDAAITAPPLAP